MPDLPRSPTWTRDLRFPKTDVMHVERPNFNTRLEVTPASVNGVVFKGFDGKPGYLTEQGTLLPMNNIYHTNPEIAERLVAWYQDFERMMEGAENDLVTILRDAGRFVVVKGPTDIPGAVSASPVEPGPT